MKLVVGLGNPGVQYVGTRHNIGFEVVDALAIKLGLVRSVDEFNRRAKTKFDGLFLDGILPSGEKLLLLMPMTYMNRSGQSVQQAASFYQLAPADEIMIVLDDLALPCGRMRLRASGSSGGHNGLKDIERALGTSDYPRLRIGIDPPPTHVPGKDYVLGRFTDEQRQRIAPVIARATDALITWIDRGIIAAMNQFNASETDERSAQKTKDAQDEKDDDNV